MGKKWGIRTDLRNREFLPSIHKMPKELMDIASRICLLTQPVMNSFCPNEANAISYEKSKGHYLGSHCDDRQLSGKFIVNLSLQGDAVMTYTKDRKKSGVGAEKYRVTLKRRSLQIQTGISRYDYKHGIPNEQLMSERRVSITFRQNASVGIE
jgi:alkylated DNA repair dioxygenase AlkB